MMSESLDILAPQSIQLLTRSQGERRLAITDSTPKAYDGPCVLLDWAEGGRSGMTIDLRHGLPGPTGAHPFRNIPSGREKGQRFKIVVTHPVQVDGGEPVVVYAGEALLLRWVEADTSGMWVRLLLDDGPDGVKGSHPFKGMAVGRKDGEPLEFAAWGISDEDSPVAVSKMRTRTPWHQLNEVTQSNIMCRQPGFQQYLERNLARLIPDIGDRQMIQALAGDRVQFASAATRHILQVPTRAIMNTDSTEAMKARTRWRTLMAGYEDVAFHG